jgi:hypothetical protein
MTSSGFPAQYGSREDASTGYANTFPELTAPAPPPPVMKPFDVGFDERPLIGDWEGELRPDGRLW